MVKVNGWVIDWCRKAAEDQGSQLALECMTSLTSKPICPCTPQHLAYRGHSMKGREGSRGDRAGEHVTICEAQILDASPAEWPASFPSQTQQLLQRAATAASCKAVTSVLLDEHCSSSFSLGLQLAPTTPSNGPWSVVMFV